MAVLKKIKFGESTNNIAKTIVQGKPEGVIAVTNTAEHSNTESEDKDYSYDIDVNIDGTTIVKDGETTKSLKVGTVPAAQVSVDNSDAGITATTAQAAFKELKKEIADVISEGKTYSIVDDTENVQDLPSNVLKRYRLQQTVGSSDPTLVGEPIDILKDNSLLAAKLSTMDATWNGSAIVDGEGEEALVLVYEDANGTPQVIAINVSAFLKEAEFGDGLQVTNGVVSAKLGNGIEFGKEATGNKSLNVKIDSTSEQDSQSTPADFLTVGANGIKISGIKDEINRKIAALDVTDTEVTGKYVSSVSETDGKITVARADVSAAKLNNYAKGTAELPLAATDTINEAFSKIEVSIEKNENVTSAALNDIKAKIDGMDTDIDAEIAARKAVDGQSGDTYAANSGTNYISAATSLNDADVKLDTALKSVSDKVNGIKYNVSDTTLILSGISQDSTLS